MENDPFRMIIRYVVPRESASRERTDTRITFTKQINVLAWFIEWFDFNVTLFGLG